MFDFSNSRDSVSDWSSHFEGKGDNIERKVDYFPPLFQLKACKVVSNSCFSYQSHARHACPIIQGSSCSCFRSKIYHNIQDTTEVNRNTHTHILLLSLAHSINDGYGILSPHPARPAAISIMPKTSRKTTDPEIGKRGKLYQTNYLVSRFLSCARFSYESMSSSLDGWGNIIAARQNNSQKPAPASVPQQPRNDGRHSLICTFLSVISPSVRFGESFGESRQGQG